MSRDRGVVPARRVTRSSHALSQSFRIPLARREESFSLSKAPASPPPLPPPSQGGERDRSLATSFHRAQQKHASRNRPSSSVNSNFSPAQCEARWVRFGEPRISQWIHLLEPALDLRRKAVDRVLTRAPNERGNATVAIDEKMEGRISELGAKATKRLGSGEVGRHDRVNFGQGRADSIRLVGIDRRGHHGEPPVRLEALPDALELRQAGPA